MLSYFEYLMTVQPNDALALLICLPCVKGGAEQSEAEGLLYLTHRCVQRSEKLRQPLTAMRSGLACGRVTMKSDKSDEITK